MRLINFILLISVVLLGITFACLNAESVTINYYFKQSTLPLSLLLVFDFGMGMVLGLLVSMVNLFKMKSENYRLKSKISLVEKEVENLRAIPIQDRH